jgi:hypothetical protein
MTKPKEDNIVTFCSVIENEDGIFEIAGSAARADLLPPGVELMDLEQARALAQELNRKAAIRKAKQQLRRQHVKSGGQVQ